MQTSQTGISYELSKFNCGKQISGINTPIYQGRQNVTKGTGIYVSNYVSSYVSSMSRNLYL